MKAQNPATGEWVYFVDKCLPFGASISCAIFQRFSDALKHLIEYRARAPGSITNYLDNFLFVALMLMRCNYLIQEFLNLCEEVGVLIALDKTEWGTLQLVFLGILLDSQHFTLAVPMEKKIKALNLLEGMLAEKKATVKDLQTLCGYLNFLCKAVFPGRVFVRKMYSKFSQVMQLPGPNDKVDKLV